MLPAGIKRLLNILKRRNEKIDEKQKLIDGCTVVNKESSDTANAGLTRTEYKEDDFTLGNFRNVITSLYSEHESRDRRWALTTSDISARDQQDGVSLADCGCTDFILGRLACITLGGSTTCEVPKSQQSDYDEVFTLECQAGWAVSFLQGLDYDNGKGDRLFQGGCTKIEGLKSGQKEGTREWSEYQNEFDQSEFTWGASAKGLIESV
jgi:hypothetical protein